MPNHRHPVRLRPCFPVALFALLCLAAPSVHAVSFHSTAIDLTPDGLEVWVVNPDHGSVSVIQALGVNTLLAEIPVGREPWCLDVHPTNGEVWVGSYRDDEITIIDAATRTVIGSIDTGFETFGVAFNPAGTTALVTASGADRIHEIDVATRAVTRTVDVYRRPRGVAWSNDGSHAWITHLLTPGYFGRLTEFDAGTGATSEILLRQVFGTDLGGYPSAMQNLTLAPAPADTLLWLPNIVINSAKGGLSGVPLTPTNLFHAGIRPINTNTGEDLNWDTYFLSEGGTPNTGFAGGTTPVAGPVAVDFRLGRAYVANLHSDNVTVLDDNLLYPVERHVFPAGSAPIGIVTHPGPNHRAYVANWLSRDVTVINTSAMTIVATVPTTTTAALDPAVLHGKQLFFTSTGKMSFENRNSCGSCHVFGRPDARTWDLSQFGKRIRATKDWRGAGWTPPYGWTASFDEIHDNEWSIIGLMGGEGLTPLGPNPNLGAPNAGLCQDLDDLSLFIALERYRPDTPFLNPDGSLTAEADSGRVLFHDPVVACATCHVPPFYTDSTLDENPFILHDVGTADPEDLTTAAGLDTPSLIGIWDQAPYLHNHRAKTLEEVLTTFNVGDQHGTTSHLDPQQITFLADFMRSIGWPEDSGSPVDAPTIARPALGEGALTFPNPFREQTSLRFELAPGRGAHVTVEVIDVNGRRVRTLFDRRLPGGSHTVGWDGTDEASRRVAAGVYFARLVIDGDQIRTKKMTRMR